jgi:hypothetical protein
MPTGLVMTCTATDVSTGEVIGNIPSSSQPPTDQNWPGDAGNTPNTRVAAWDCWPAFSQGSAVYVLAHIVA